MKIMQVTVQVGRAETASAEVLVLMHCEGEGLARQDAALLNRPLGGALSNLVQSKEFEGKANEVLLYHTQDRVPAKRLVLVGLGKKNQVTLEKIRQAMGSAAKRTRQTKVGSFTAVLPTVIPGGMSSLEVTQAMVEGAILGSYQFTVYRSETASGQDVAEMKILIPRKSQLRQATEGIRRGVATAEATVFVRDLCNHPSNVLTPTRVADEAKTIAKTERVMIAPMPNHHAKVLTSAFADCRLSRVLTLTEDRKTVKERGVRATTMTRVPAPNGVPDAERSRCSPPHCLP